MSFCVKCGETCEDTVEGLCMDCFLDGRKLTILPHHVDLFRCTNCNNFNIRNNWVDKSIKAAIDEVVMDNISIIKEAKLDSIGILPVEQESCTFVAMVEATLEVGEYMVDDTASTIVRIKNAVCKRCSRKLGNYYEATLQLRSISKEFDLDLKDEALARIENQVDRSAKKNREIFITKMEIVTGGVDIYLSSISLGKAITKELSEYYCAYTKEAAKLVGQTSDGQDMYRLTYLIRLPDFRVGDVVTHKGKYYKLLKLSSAGGKLMDLNDFREMSIRRSDSSELKVYAKKGDLMDASVIGKSKNEIQILNPINYSATDIRMPEGMEIIDDTVKVIDIDDILYLVP